MSLLKDHAVVVVVVIVVVVVVDRVSRHVIGGGVGPR